MLAVKTTSLGKIYHGGVHGLTDFTLSIDEGQVFGLLGPNGAGKTTAVRLLNGTLKPTDGESETIEIESEDDINTHLRRIMESGAKIHEVSKNDRDLESLYYKYVGRSTDELA
jgi:ABC-type multidrug transport system ATPase subunit